MLIGGLQKTSLIDFPGHLSCVVFTVGCNFRCPFCHNRELVTLKNFKKSKLKLITEEEFFSFLKKRQDILDGAVITGGEPTLQKDLKDFCKKIKTLGFKIKLDTNGSNPQLLKEIIKAKLLDYVAIDIKNDWANYWRAIGLKNDQAERLNLKEKIKKSVSLVLRSKIGYEFRTTIVPGIHTKAGLKRMAVWFKKIRIKKGKWFWQDFRPENCLSRQFMAKQPFPRHKLEHLLNEIAPKIATVR